MNHITGNIYQVKGTMYLIERIDYDLDNSGKIDLYVYLSDAITKVGVRYTRDWDKPSNRFKMSLADFSRKVKMDNYIGML